MSEKEFNWKGYQKFMGYSDEDLETFKSDPRRAESTKKLMSREILKKNLIVEVVKSHGCCAGMKPGDKLVFKALSLLDMEKSSKNWCAHAFGPIPIWATVVQDRFATGHDDEEMIYTHFSCGDTGPLCGGWGQVVMKGYLAENPDV